MSKTSADSRAVCCQNPHNKHNHICCSGRLAPALQPAGVTALHQYRISLQFISLIKTPFISLLLLSLRQEAFLGVMKHRPLVVNVWIGFIHKNLGLTCTNKICKSWLSAGFSSTSWVMDCVILADQPKTMNKNLYYCLHNNVQDSLTGMKTMRYYLKCYTSWYN